MDRSIAPTTSAESAGLAPALPVRSDAEFSRTVTVALIRGVWLQSVRRNEFAVLLILLALYLVGVLILRVVGIDSADTARFVTGLGLSLGSMLASVLVIALGARQVPVELELRTIYPVLAKPLSRNRFLVGKALPTWTLGVVALLLFTVVTLIAVPGLPYQHPAALAQALVLRALSLALLTALVFWLALWLPSSVAMLLAAAICFLGAPLGNFIASALGDSAAAGLLSHLLPRLALLDQFDRYADGGAPLSAAAMATLLLYGGLWTAIASWLTARRFGRMPL